MRVGRMGRLSPPRILNGLGKRNLAPGIPEYPANTLDDVKGARRDRLGINPDPESVGARPWVRLPSKSVLILVY